MPEIVIFYWQMELLIMLASWIKFLLMHVAVLITVSRHYFGNIIATIIDADHHETRTSFVDMISTLCSFIYVSLVVIYSRVMYYKLGHAPSLHCAGTHFPATMVCRKLIPHIEP